jgi:deazaflavin-dependent oxidoreductase (nitroreductase family)
VNPLARTFNALGGRLMARTGRIGILGTTGARTGLPRTAPIGFVARDDGTVLIGAGSRTNRGWTANLKANPEATFSIKGVERRYRARLVAAEDREAALAELKAKMGGMAERADWGDLFVLEPEATTR